MDQNAWTGITDEELQGTREWLDSKGAQPRCPACGGEAFNTLRPIAAPVLNDDRSGPVPNQVWALLPVSCDNCAHVLFFNAERMGILSAE